MSQADLKQAVFISILSKNRSLTAFIFWYFMDFEIFIYEFSAVEYVHHMHLYSTRLNMSNSFVCCIFMFMPVLRVLRYALISLIVKLLCRHSTLTAKVSSNINFSFYITIIMLFLFKISGKLNLRFCALMLTSPNTLDFQLLSLHSHSSQKLFLTARH